MTTSAGGVPPRFRVYTREQCELCDDFIAELAPLLAVRGATFARADVDADPVAKRRFGLKVPVLTYDGSVVCHGRLDRDAVSRLL
ncbi:MAG: glutaredoxin family protein [Gammaproteobacteria bacterium]